MNAAIILAAGSGRRLGGVAKAVLTCSEGVTFLAAICDTARRAGLEHFVVIAGPPYGDQTRSEAARLNLPSLTNPEPSRGMSSSVAVGFEYALQRFAGFTTALLWPVDHMRVRVDTVQKLLARATARDIVIPTFDRRGGHPTGFGRDLWQDLAACGSAPQGARSVVRSLRSRHPNRVKPIEVTDAGVTADVDTPADLEARAQNEP